MKDAKVTVARYIPTERPLHIVKASNGLSCNCNCLKCGKQVEAIQGVLRKWHFRHYVSKGCTISQETALHILAKDIVANETWIRISENEDFKYQKGIIHKKIDIYESDVVISNLSNEIIVEIAVTHFIEPDKEKYYKDNDFRAIEIDLSKVDRQISYEDLKDLLINETNNKRIIENQVNQEKITVKDEEPTSVGDHSNSHSVVWSLLKIAGIAFFVKVGFDFLKSFTNSKR